MAMFEQWSATLSKLVVKSESINPSSVVHSPVLNRLICFFLISIIRSFITSSSGSTVIAIPYTIFSNAFIVMSSISFTASE